MLAVSDNHLSSRWQQRPSGSTWDPALAVRTGAGDHDGVRFVPLDSLLASVGQGVYVGRAAAGDVAVRLVRVSDLHPLLIGDGEVGRIGAGVVRRHLAVDGDLLISRVGRLGQVGCVTHATESLVPHAGLFVARPLKKSWGPAIAAALCTSHARGFLNGLLVGTRSASLTIDQLSEVPVPSPSHFDFSEVEELVGAAGELVRAGCEILDRVRGQLGIMLEGAPAEPSGRTFTWVAEPAWLRGWGWSDVQRHLLVTRSRLRAGAVVRLGDVIDLDSSRAKTADVVARVRALDSGDVRPDWYLALPARNHAPQQDGPDQLTARLTPRRFFEIDRECLLIPTAGDITGAPVVLPDPPAGPDHPPVMVPIYWLPLVGLDRPRALAMVLDHPFVRLQRQLAGAFSTVTHITRGDVADLLIPAASDDVWDRWEAELREAHGLFMDADAKAKEAIAIAEGWYK